MKPTRHKPCDDCGALVPVVDSIKIRCEDSIVRIYHMECLSRDQQLQYRSWLHILAYLQNLCLTISRVKAGARIDPISRISLKHSGEMLADWVEAHNIYPDR